MAHSVKRAVSLRREQDEQLQRLAERRKTPYSRLVQEAIDLLLRSEEQSRIAQAYKRYYGEGKNAARDRSAALELCRLLRGS